MSRNPSNVLSIEDVSSHDGEHAFRMESIANRLTAQRVRREVYYLRQVQEELRQSLGEEI